MFGTGELIEFYRINFLLMNEHNFSLSDIDNMTPFEREIYLLLLVEHLKKRREAIKRARGSQSFPMS